MKFRLYVNNLDVRTTIYGTPSVRDRESVEFCNGKTLTSASKVDIRNRNSTMNFATNQTALKKPFAGRQIRASVQQRAIELVLFMRFSFLVVTGKNIWFISRNVEWRSFFQLFIHSNRTCIINFLQLASNYTYYTTVFVFHAQNYIYYLSAIDS